MISRAYLALFVLLALVGEGACGGRVEVGRDFVPSPEEAAEKGDGELGDHVPAPDDDDDDDDDEVDDDDDDEVDENDDDDDDEEALGGPELDSARLENEQ